MGIQCPGKYKIMFEKGILKVYSIIIGVLFIISGLGKVIDTSGFSNLISQYGLGYLMILSPIIVVFEILLGLFLVLLINPKFYAMISFGLLTIFTALFTPSSRTIASCGKKVRSEFPNLHN